MDFSDFPPVENAAERLKRYRDEMEREKAECQRIREKMARGEETTRNEAVFWAYSTFGSAASCHHSH